MHEPRFTQTDMNRHSGLIIAEASRQPVIITVHNTSTAVILSVEDYNRMIEAVKERWADCPENISPRLRTHVMAAPAQDSSESFKKKT